MRSFIVANGGPLALVVIGLGLAGYTNSRIGWALVGVGVVCWIVATTYPRLPWHVIRKDAPPNDPPRSSLSAEDAGRIVAGYEAAKQDHGQVAQRAIVEQLERRSSNAPTSLVEALGADRIARERDAGSFSRWIKYGHELRNDAVSVRTRDELNHVCESIHKWITGVENSLLTNRPEYYGDFKRSSDIPWALQSKTQVAEAMDRRMAVLETVVKDLRK